MRSELIIDLSKLDANLAAIKKRVSSAIKIMAVVKDDAYGHGMIPIAIHLEPSVDWFCVARIEEAVELRKSGIQIPILVFEVPRKKDAWLYLEYGITATLTDVSTFEILQEGTEYHINFDTGMRRLGITEQDFVKVIERSKKETGLFCTGIYTHFATSDEPGSEAVFEQKRVFESIRKKFPARFFAHVANSGALFYYEDANLSFDGVRPGVCLYGYGAGVTPVQDLVPVIEWKSYIMQIRKIKKGDGVGYGAAWVADRDGYIGTVPVGYADGIPRVLSGKFEVEINGAVFQQVGRVAMNYFTVFSDKKDFCTNDDVLIFNGEQLNPSVWAQSVGTIPYEITTGLNSRIKRKFV